MTAPPRTADGPGTVGQIFGFLGGMTAYAIHLMLGTTFVPLSCELSATWPIHLLTAAVLAVIAASAWFAWATVRGVRDRRAAGGAVSERRAFLGRVGLLLNAGAFLVVVFAELPVWFFDPCLP